MKSDTISMNTVKESRTVMLSETFSPASGGIQNTSRVNIDSIIHGSKMFMM